jgi:hypothetical protein
MTSYKDENDESTVQELAAVVRYSNAHNLMELAE